MVAPTSITKHKDYLNSLTPEKLHARFKEISSRNNSSIELEARKQAWRHGYGKMSSHYFDKMQHVSKQNEMVTLKQLKESINKKEFAIPFASADYHEIAGDITREHGSSKIADIHNVVKRHIHDITDWKLDSREDDDPKRATDDAEMEHHVKNIVKHIHQKK